MNMNQDTRDLQLMSLSFIAIFAIATVAPFAGAAIGYALAVPLAIATIIFIFFPCVGAIPGAILMGIGRTTSPDWALDKLADSLDISAGVAAAACVAQFLHSTGEHLSARLHKEEVSIYYFNLDELPIGIGTIYLYFLGWTAFYLFVISGNVFEYVAISLRLMPP